MFVVVKNGEFLRLEGPFEYWRLVDDVQHATPMGRNKATVYANIVNGNAVLLQ